MSDFDNLINRAKDIAKSEGLFDGSDVGIKRALPDPAETKLNLDKVARVAERLAEEGIIPSNLGSKESRQKATSSNNTSTETVLVKPPKETEDSKSEQPISPISKAEIIVKEQLDYLASWYDINLFASRKDRIRYWMLKIPALISTVCITAFEAFGYGNIVIILGAVAAFCVGVDAAFPGGQLHNIHKKAANEIRRLQHDVITKWRQAQLGDEKLLSKEVKIILDEIRGNRTRIDNYVTEAEASLGKAKSIESDK